MVYFDRRDLHGKMMEEQEEQEEQEQEERVCPTSNEYLGPELGDKTFYQLTYQQFHEDCLQKNSEKNDSTGKRLYAGGHVGIRFLQRFKFIFENQSALELGCGTGVIGLTTLLTTPLQRILLTDGAEETLRITQQNIPMLLPPEKRNQASEQLLFWGNSEHIQRALEYNHNQKYDIIFGMELMYYNTDIPNLVSTILSLTNPLQGSFFHVHLFRKYGQEREMVEEFEKHHWTTFQIPHKEFITRKERDEHPEWNQIKAFISCSSQRLLEMIEKYGLKGQIFDGTVNIDDLEEEEDAGDEKDKHHETTEKADLSSFFESKLN